MPASPDEWRTVWQRLGVSAPGETFRELIARYSEPHRKYHTLQHLDECLGKLREIEADAVHPAEVELALWFHDAIYDVSHKDNEERSAEWARATVLAAGLPDSMADRVHALVMATRHDAVPGGVDAQILVDVDLSILGAEPGRFGEYEAQVRQEYARVPEPLYRAARAKILRGFLQRPAIFNTVRFIAAYERQARKNLEGSIAKLAR